jgi:hypothetical protein
VNRRPLWLALWITAVLWFGLLWFTGQPISFNGLKLFVSIPTAVLLLVGLFDSWAWRWPVVRQYLSQVPDVRGTWRGQLVTTWRNQDGELPPPLTVYLVVRQNYSSISARLLSEQSSSETRTANLIKAPDGVVALAAIYRNEPRLTLRAKSPIHYGAFQLVLEGDPVTRMRGHYWTDRSSGGELEFAERGERLAGGYAEASGLAFKEKVTRQG